MRILVILSMLGAVLFGGVACSEQEEDRVKPTPIPQPTPDTTIRTNRTLFRYPIMDFSFDVNHESYHYAYAIISFSKINAFTLMSTDNRRIVSFISRVGDWTSLTDVAVRNTYRSVYGDRQDTTHLQTMCDMAINIDKIQVMQRDSVRDVLVDVSQNYTLIYNDSYDFVRIPPRKAYTKQQLLINEKTIPVSACDSLLCRWAFDLRVPPHIVPMAHAKPDRNTFVVITLTGGKQLMVSWEDAEPFGPYRGEDR